ncbi:hypothetical protein BD770DRAFT_439554 [Pilaira anomala]|nr:hypothetical protein BD770DRAFT_439554 [Pilaira anomala]
MPTKQLKVEKIAQPVVDTPAIAITSSDEVTSNGEAAINTTGWANQPSVSQQRLINRDQVVSCDDSFDGDEEDAEEIQKILDTHKAEEEKFRKKIEAMKRKATDTSYGNRQTNIILIVFFIINKRCRKYLISCA